MEDDYFDDLLLKQDGEKLDLQWDETLKEWVPKGRVYVSHPDEVPEGFEVQEGDQGGFFYETSDGDSGTDAAVDEGGSPPEEEVDGEGAESGADLSVIEEPYRGQLDDDFSQEAAQTLLGMDEEAGAEYIHEALHQNGDYFDGFDSVDEVVEDFRLYQEMI